MHRLDIFQQGALDALLYPPRGIGAEAVAAVRVEVIHRSEEAEVAFLNEVAQAHPPIAELLCDINNQPEVAAYELVSGPRVVFFDDKFAQIAFLFGCKQGCFVNLFEIFFYGGVKCYSGLPPSRRSFDLGRKGKLTVFFFWAIGPSLTKIYVRYRSDMPAGLLCYVGDFFLCVLLSLLLSIRLKQILFSVNAP